jgi:hypothetical protein
VLKRYSPGPFDSIKLSPEEERKLNAGQPVMKQQLPTRDDPEGGGGGAICVQDVAAPRSAVWSQILDLDSYRSKVSKVNESRNYYVKRHPDGTCTIKTKQVLGVLPGYSVRRVA